MDLPLQVAYQGPPGVLKRDFFEPVASASCEYRVRLSTVAPEVLSPVSLGLSDWLAGGHTVQLLVALPVQKDSASGTAEGRGIPRLGASEELDAAVRRLKILNDHGDSGDLSRLVERFNVKIVGLSEGEETDSNSTSGTVGFFTDDSGASVSYHVDCVESSCDGAMAPLFASWTWGDPSARVRKGINKFESLWNSETARTVTDEVKAALLAVLLYLERHPRFQEKSDAPLQLFPHQERAIEAWVGRDLKGVFKMCTGSGKTVSALAGVRYLTKLRRESSQRIPPVIISVPTRVLADQWIREIKRFGFESVLAAYNDFEQWNQPLEPTLRTQSGSLPRFIVTTYRTFADPRFVAKIRRAGESGVEAVWVADEMHNLSSSRLRGAMKQVEKLFPFRLGLSATPEIEGDLATTEYLLDYFGGICASYELSDGIRDGVLCPYRYFPTPAYLAPETGEKYLKLLSKIGDPKSSSDSLINAYRETRDLLRTSGVQVAKFRDLLKSLVESSADLRHTLIYCPPGYGKTNSEITDEIDTDVGERRLIEEVIQVLREHGLSVASILGETPEDQRTEILGRFANGSVNTLCAIGCLDEGVDVPSIQRAIVLYSVDREKQFVQRRGRILRQPKGVTGKVAEIFDIVILPHGSAMPAAQSEALLAKELRRYHQFASLALNQNDADAAIEKALSVATSS